MIDFSKIENYSFRYRLLKFYAGFLHKLYYKKIEVTGLENIPQEGAVIFAPNHQNALMDALAVLFTTKGQPVFLARADIFKKNFVARMLRFIKIMPVFRIRDGKDSLQNNETIFEQCVRILSAEKTLILLPEGNHADLWRLRPLKKGLARIAMQAEAENQFQLPLRIVPVGIHYDNYQKLRSKLLVNFGQPINVQDFYEEDYKEPVALNKLTKRLSESIKPLMIHIKSTDHYSTYKSVIQFCDGNRFALAKGGGKLKRKFDISKKLVSFLETTELEKPALFEKIADITEKITKTLKEVNTGPTDFWMRKRTWPGILLQSILLILGLPFFILGLIGNILIFFPPKKFSEKIRDKQFVSSIRYGLKIVLVPLTYLIIFLLVLFLTPLNWWMSLIFIFILPILGVFSYDYTTWFKNHISDWRVVLHFHRNEEKKLRGHTSELFEMLNNFDKV